MRSRRILAFTSALALLVVPLIVAPAVAANDTRSADARATADGSVHPGRSAHDRVVAFWTPARLAAAQPIDMTPLGAPTRGAKPGGTKGVTGASWTRGGAVLDRTGKVFFERAGAYWQCSGSIAQDSRSGQSIVLTAAHCAFDLGTGTFVTNWMFIPNWDAAPAGLATACSATRYGCWTAERLYVQYGYASAGAFNEQAVTHDWAFALVGLGGLDGVTELDLALGGYPLTSTTTTAGETLGAFGYPATGRYDGNDLTYCAGPIFADVSIASGSTWGMRCDMTGGSSGGPWFDDYNASRQAGWKLAAVTSYGYGDNVNLYGPRFTARTQETYAAADAAAGSGDGVIVGVAP